MGRRWGITVSIAFMGLASTLLVVAVDPWASEAPAPPVVQEIEGKSRTSTSWTPASFPANEISNASVTLQPGDDPGAVINGSPPGTTFVFSPGIYLGLEVSPRPNDVFVGEPGAILEGEDTAAFAFAAQDPELPVRGVTIRGLIIRNYATPLQLGTVGGGGAVGWVIEGNEISHSRGAAIEIATKMVIRDNYLHDNGQLGIHGGSPTSGVLIQGNEIAFNNPDDLHDMAWEAGGVKVVETRDLIIRRNFVHDNGGPGLWTDRDNVGSVFEDNTLIDNDGPGILHEISYSALIRNNVVGGNAHVFFLGGILVLSSADVEVYGNELSGNDGGIAAINDDRGAGPLGTYQIDNLWVHDNNIEYDTGWTGVRDTTGRVVAARFDRNSYEVRAQIQPFYWLDSHRTRQQWIRLGQDLSSNWDGENG